MVQTNNKKIKILAFSPTYYPCMGGVERTEYELYGRLTQKNISVDLVTPNLGGKKVEYVNKKFRIFRTGKKKTNIISKFIFYQLNQYFTARKLIKDNKYDLVHNQFILPSGVTSYLISRKIKKPLITSVHHFGTGRDICSPEENPKIINPILRFILKNSKKIITTGKTQNNFLNWLLNKYPINTCTIELGSPKIIKITGKKKEKLKKKYGFKNKKIIFSIGRLTKRKKFDEIIKIAKKIKQKNIIFIIAGKGNEYSNLKTLIKKYKLEKKIILTGYINDKIRKDFFLMSDIFFYASEFEGSGIVYTEAMSFSLPVIAYENEAIRNIIKNNRYGIVTKRNSEDAKLKIKDLLNNQNKREKIITNCYNLINKTHNWDTYSKRYATIIKEILENEK